MLTNLQI